MNYPSLKDKTSRLDTGDCLADGENPYSTNKVTGHSLNFPIGPTCLPTKVCVETCYFGKGPSTWPSSLSKQLRLYNSTVADPEGTARRIVVWTRKLKLSYVRWNGGGDLFDESVRCLNAAALMMPDIPQWVVTRLSQHAMAVEPRPNVYLHFSVDRFSWARLKPLLSRDELQWFWSYQCEPSEVPVHPIAPVVFRDQYDPKGDALHPDDCPLNANDDITGVCGKCRRCFNGEAVARGRELVSVLRKEV